MERDQVIVVGGGLAGLTAAATLARRGHAVTVFEGAEHLGGRARSRQRDGFTTNLGPHALYKAGGGRNVLRALGVEIRGSRPRLERSGVLIAGELVPTMRFLRTLVSDRLRVAKAMAGLGERAAAAWVGRPVGEWIDSVTDDPTGRSAVASVVRTATYSADVTLLDAGAATTQLRTAAHGVLYLDAGWSSLVDGLADIVRANGGTIETNCRVEAVEHDHRVRSIRLADGHTRPATSAVIAVNDPARAAALVDGAARSRLEEAAGAAVPLRMAHLDVALRPLPADHFPNLLGIDEDVYLNVPSSVTDNAPAGAGTVHVGRYLRPGEEHLDHRASLEAVLDRHQPDWRDHVVDARYVPRSLVAGDHARPATRGSADRPDVVVTGVPGLAVAGDWVGPSGMIADASILSGAAAAGAIVAAMLDHVPPTPVRT